MHATGRVLASLGLALALAACGGSSAASPVVPEGWEVHESPELGYVMAHPADWDVAFDSDFSEVVYMAPDGAEIRVNAFRVEDELPADILFQSAEDDAAERFGIPPAVVNELTLPDGARVLIFANQYTDGGGAFFFQRAVVLDAPFDLWYLDWRSDILDQGGDRERFLEFVRSFVPAPNLGDVEGA